MLGSYIIMKNGNPVSKPNHIIYKNLYLTLSILNDIFFVLVTNTYICIMYGITTDKKDLTYHNLSDTTFNILETVLHTYQ